MNRWRVDPAVWMLLRLQMQGRLRRVRGRLLQPRRLVLTGLALALGLVWLANAVGSVVLREPADPAFLRAIIALALTAYTAWHIIRVACFRPEDPLEMPESVRDVLAECPLRADDLVAHHLAGAFTAAIFKAGCVALLLLPDLKHPALSFVGLAAALWIVDLVRISLEISTWGMAQNTYRAYRGAVLAALAGVCWYAADAVRLATLEAMSAASETQPFQPALVFFGHVRETPVDQWSQGFWAWLLHPVLAERLGAAELGWTTLALAVVAAFTWSVFRLYGWTVSRAARREQQQFLKMKSSTKQEGDNGTTDLPGKRLLQLPRPVGWGGAGPLAWRQMIGAARYTSGLVTAMAAPGALSLIPLFAPVSAEGAFLAVVGGLAFYSFLLLPTALRFDFRRDLERITILKALPISSFAAAMGQVATPVLTAAAFQTIVILIALYFRPVSLGLAGGALLMLVLLDLFIFALENVIFLWYPHHLRQEGLEIFLRTTLVFTAKGVLFLVALAAIVAWSGPARMAANALSRLLGVAVSGYTTFFLGILLLVGCAISAAFAMLAHAFAEFDPAEDRPL